MRKEKKLKKKQETLEIALFIILGVVLSVSSFLIYYLIEPQNFVLVCVVYAADFLFMFGMMFALTWHEVFWFRLFKAMLFVLLYVVIFYVIVFLLCNIILSVKGWVKFFPIAIFIGPSLPFLFQILLLAELKSY